MPLCVAASMGFYDFFPVGGPLCVRTLRFYGFFAVCGAPVSGDFEILRVLPLCCVRLLCVGTLRIYVFSPVCGPCVGDFEIFRKNPHREKSRVWEFEMAVTQRKKH